MIWMWLGAATALAVAGRPGVTTVRLISPTRLARTGPQGTIRWWEPIYRLGRLDRLGGGWHARSAQADAAWRRFSTAGVAAAALLLTLGIGGSVAAGLAAGVAAAACARSTYRRMGARAQARDECDLIQALAMLEAELTAGAREGDALLAAAALAGRHRRTFLAAAATARLGGDVAAVLGPPGTPRSLAALAAGWHVRAVCGAPLSDLVSRVRGDVEIRAARDREVETALAGPRSSAALLTLLPVLGLVLGAAMGAHPTRFLFGTQVGSVVLLAGVLADVSGAGWIALLVRRARR